jgi:putative photosynthetic complex assembly protein
MSEAAHHDEIKVPKAALIAAGTVLFFALAAATTVRVTGYGGTHMTLPAMVESRDLQFADAPDGAVLVLEAGSGEQIAALAPGTYGFVRVVLRGLARERKIASISAEPSFRLARYENGQVTLTDLATKKVIDLNAFGSSNLDAFAHLMKLKGGSQ